MPKDLLIEELRCRCGCRKIGGWPVRLAKLKKALSRLRALLRRPLVVTSGFRCIPHNSAVGGVPNSFHTQCLAVDFYCEGTPLNELRQLALQAGFAWAKIYADEGFVHADLRGAK